MYSIDLRVFQPIRLLRYLWKRDRQRREDVRRLRLRQCRLGLSLDEGRELLGLGGIVYLLGGSLELSKSHPFPWRNCH